MKNNVIEYGDRFWRGVNEDMPTEIPGDEVQRFTFDRMDITFDSLVNTFDEL